MRLDRPVVIPVAVIKLDEPRSSFGQPTSKKTVGPKRAITTLGPIHVKDMLWLIFNVHQFRHAGLHAKCHFVLSNPSRYFGIARGILLQLVHGVDRIDDFALTNLVHPLGILNVKNRVALTAKLNSLKATGQETGMPLPRRDRLLLSKLARRHHDHKTREVLGLATQTVQQPTPHRRPSRDHVARVHESMGRVVIDGLGEHRSHHAHLVGTMGRQLGPDGAQTLPRLAPFFEGVLGRETIQFLALELGNLLSRRHRLGHRLPVHLLKLGFMVKGVEVTHSPRHIQPDHTLRLGREMRRRDHTL